MPMPEGKREYLLQALVFLLSFRLSGEVEVVFGLWAIPLLAFLAWNFGWTGMIDYVDRWDFKEPLYILVTMAIASTYPILHAFEHGAFRILRLFLWGRKGALVGSSVRPLVRRRL